MRFHITLVAVTVGIGLVSCARAQRPESDEVHISSRPYQVAPLVIRAEATSVETDVVVRNQVGLPVGGLTQDNFRILDNDEARPIASFAVVTAPAAKPPAAGSSTPPSPPRQPATVTPLEPSRYLVLYFDDVNTGGSDLGHARIAAERFAREALGPNDRVAVLTGSGLQSLDFATDRAQLLAAIEAVRTHPRASKGTDGGCLRITAYQAYLIVNHLDPSAMAAAMANKGACDKQIGLFDTSVTSAYTGGGIPGGDESSETVLATADAIWSQTRAASQNTLRALENTVDFLAHQPGTRVLLLASGGFLAGTLENQQDAIIQRALHNQVTINALDARGLYAAGPGLPLSELSQLGVVPLAMYQFQESSKLSEDLETDAAMANLAQSTGGLLFHNNNDLTLGFYRLGLTAETTYKLAFTPTGLAHDGKFHRLKIEVIPDKHYAVQARQGYFAPPPEDAAGVAQDAIDAAMRDSQTQSGLPATVSARAEYVRTGPEVAVHIHIDLAGLPFLNAKGRRSERLTFVAGLFDAHGRFVVGKEAEMDLALKSGTWRKMVAEGLDAGMSLPAAPGAYQLRCVIQESNGGKLYAVNNAVTLSH